MVNGLTGILDPNYQGIQADYLNWHVVQTLGKIGPPAQSALAKIAQIRSTDPTFNAARDAAVKSITAEVKASTPAPAAAGPKPEPAPNPATIVGLELDLSSQSPATQLAALKSLGGLKMAALPLLQKIVDLMVNAGDFDVRREAAVTSKTLIDLLLAAKDPVLERRR